MIRCSCERLRVPASMMRFQQHRLLAVKAQPSQVSSSTSLRQCAGIVLEILSTSASSLAICCTKRCSQPVLVPVRLRCDSVGCHCGVPSRPKSPRTLARIPCAHTKIKQHTGIVERIRAAYLPRKRTPASEETYAGPNSAPISANEKTLNSIVHSILAATSASR